MSEEDKEAPPVVGDWYKNENGDSFEVVAYDPDDLTVEVQFYDGTVEEFELDTWNQLQIESIEPPEDWAGSYDIEREDYGVDSESHRSRGWSNPLDSI